MGVLLDDRLCTLIETLCSGRVRLRRRCWLAAVCKPAAGSRRLARPQRKTTRLVTTSGPRMRGLESAAVNRAIGTQEPLAFAIQIVDPQEHAAKAFLECARHTQRYALPFATRAYISEISNRQSVRRRRVPARFL